MDPRRSPSLALTSGSSGLAPRRQKHYREASLKDAGTPWSSRFSGERGGPGLLVEAPQHHLTHWSPLRRPSCLPGTIPLETRPGVGFSRRGSVPGQLSPTFLLPLRAHSSCLVESRSTHSCDISGHSRDIGQQCGSNNEMSGSVYPSIHLRCVLPQCLSWGDFGSTEQGVAKRRGAGPQQPHSITSQHLAPGAPEVCRGPFQQQARVPEKMLHHLSSQVVLWAEPCPSPGCCTDQAPPTCLARASGPSSYLGDCPSDGCLVTSSLVGGPLRWSPYLGGSGALQSVTISTSSKEHWSRVWASQSE